MSIFIRKSRFRKYISVVVCFLIAANASQGVVLCYSPSGHVGLESAIHEGHCGHSHENEHGHAVQSVFENGHEDHCQPCVDVPIEAEAARLSKKIQNLKSISSVLPISRATTTSNDHLNTRFLSDGISGKSHCVLLRTVIILC